MPLSGRGLLADWMGGVTPARFDVLRRHGLAVHAQEKLCVNVVLGWLTIKPVWSEPEPAILPAVQLDARDQFSVRVVTPLLPVDVDYWFHLSVLGWGCRPLAGFRLIKPRQCNYWVMRTRGYSWSVGLLHK